MNTHWRRGRRAAGKNLADPAVRAKADPAFLIYGDLTRKFWMSKKIATARGQGWWLTLEQYIEFWLTDDREHRRVPEKLVMARVRKDDAWAWDNIECVTRKQELALRGAQFKGAYARQRAVWVGEKRFDGLREAARHFKVSAPLARYRCKKQVATLAGTWRYDDDI